MVQKKILVGVDIGGTKTAGVASPQPPDVPFRIAFPTLPEDGPEHTLERIIEGIHKALSTQQLHLDDLQAIGISCGSPLDPVNGVIQAPPNLPTWKDVPIKSILENEFGVACFLENDANAGALAEHRFGAGMGAQNMVFLTLGTGLGAGLILNRQLYCGVSHLAGEIGHVRLRRSGPEGHNKRGTAEGWASGAGMAKLAVSMVQKALARGETTMLGSFQDGGTALLTAHDVWNAAQAGDALAKRVVRIVGERLGEVLTILVDVLNPERIVIGGLALRMGTALLDPARTVLEREGLHDSVNACQILPAALGEKIGDVAALCVAVNSGNNITTKEPDGVAAL